jgi:hypothetical protein
MSLKKKLGLGALVTIGTGLVVGGFVYGLKNLRDCIFYEEEKDMVYQILDKNKNGKLSEEEKAEYYKLMGFNPGLHSIDSPSRDDLKTFLDFYMKK